jgi:hypothetical protein
VKYQYVWLFWSSAFLAPWLLLFIGQAAMRRQMMQVSWQC